jgi:Family of unknown function (DUF5317)
VIIVVCSLIAIASVLLRGGDLRRLGTLPIRHRWLVWGAIGIQTLLVSGPWTTPHTLGQVVHVGTYVMAAGFAFANRKLPGVTLISIGGMLNLAAIVANGGVMPASAAALRSAGYLSREGFSNSGEVPDANLAWLGDIFSIPAGWPLANVFSIGDIVVVLGIGVLAHVWCLGDQTGVQVPFWSRRNCSNSAASSSALGMSAADIGPGPAAVEASSAASNSASS